MNLIPNVSTHLRLLIDNIRDCTIGKIYSIEKWEKDLRGMTWYQIGDDTGMGRTWYYHEHDPEVEDASFEVNLQNILKE